jgi:flagellar hook assembly protein FlgD
MGGDPLMRIARIRYWALAALALLPAAPAEATNVSGTLNGAHRWTVAGSPYVLTSATTLAATATLEIDPGVEVRVALNTSLYVQGTLTAIGTPTSPITFTTNATPAGPGKWNALYFKPGAASSASRLEYVDLAHGGNYWGAILYIEDSSPTLDHVTVRSSSVTGIYVKGANAAPAIRNANLLDNGNYGLNVALGARATVDDTNIQGNTYALGAEPGAQLLGLAGLSMTDNGGGTKNCVYYRAGTGSITSAETWPAGADRWISASALTIATTGSLSIAPGVRVLFTPGYSLYVNGTLTAVGNDVAPIAMTTNAATPTPGSWNSLYFKPGAASSASRLEHVELSYGGNYWGAIVYIEGSSPTLDHVTVRNSSVTGIYVEGTSAAPTVRNSSLLDNGNYGLDVADGARATVTGTTVRGNAYAFGAEPNAQLSGLTGLTLADNGGGTKNGVYYRAGTGSISTAEVWPSGAERIVSPAALTIATAGSLTIAPGVTVRFSPGYSLYVNGILDARGSDALPITLTTSAASPVPGSWNALYFKPGAGASASQLAYARLEYGGNHWGGTVVIEESSPTLDHVTVSDSSSSAIKLIGASAPAIRNCTFSASAKGITNATPTNVVVARLNYWGAADGPSGAAAGSGLAVSQGVEFEPYLVDAPSSPQFVASATPDKRIFNPAGGVTADLSFTTALTGTWSVRYRDGTGAPVRAFSGTGVGGATAWDGRTEAGILVPDGTYTYDIEALSDAGPAATVATGTVILTTTQDLAILGITVSPSQFSPNGDEIQDEVTISGSFNFESVNWTVEVRNSSGGLVRSSGGAGAGFAYGWDGRDGAGVVQADATYTLTILASIGNLSATTSGTATLDRTPPIAQLTEPSSGQILSNVYQAGSTDVTVAGTASDLNFKSWTVDYGSGSAPSTWTTLASATEPVSAAPFVVWPTANRTNGSFSLRLRAYDLAGNLSTIAVPLTIGNFSLAQNRRDVDVSAGGSVIYTSVVPFTLHQRIELRTLDGDVVRVLVDAERGSGSYDDAWYGWDNSAQLVADGPYRVTSTVTSDAQGFTWDQSGSFLNNYWVNNDGTNLEPWNPLDNQPLEIPYTLGAAALVTVAFGPNVNLGVNCNPPRYCPVKDRYEGPGSKKFVWTGYDEDGAFRDEFRGVVIIGRRDKFPRSVVVVHGSRPGLGDLHVEPPIFSPFAGEQVVQVELETHLGEPVDLLVEFRNLDSQSVLRTIWLPAQSPGAIEIPWDGRADNGMFVAPGRYLVNLLARDPRGAEASLPAISTVRY